MRLVIQRVREARVTVNDGVTGSIRTGLLVFLGVSRTDTVEDADYLTGKLLGLRIFPDEEGKMNRNVQEAGGSLLIVSQFTLYGDCRKGRRPSFDQAAPPDQAQDLYNYFVESAKRGPVPVETGVFSGDHAGSHCERRACDHPDRFRGASQTMIETYGYARAGLLGNPSDGYFGKTIAFVISNFRARVLLYPSAGWKSNSPRRICRSSKTSATCTGLRAGAVTTAASGSSRH